MKVQINETVYSNKYKKSSKFNVQEAHHLAISNQQNDQLLVGLCGAVPVSQRSRVRLWTLDEVNNK